MLSSNASQLVSSLYATWGPTLWRCALRATRSSEAADDVVQEAFMALYRALRSGETIEHPRAWLLSVVRHQTGKLDRANRRRNEQLEPQDVMDSFPAEALDASKECFQQFDVEAYSAVLSKREEEVLMLRLTSLKYREIAAELGIATRTVSTLLARALAKLQAAVERQREGLPIQTRIRRDASKTLQ